MADSDVEELFTTKASSKTDAITINFSSSRAFTKIENALKDKYTFSPNKNKNGVEVQFLYQKKKVAISLFDNKTLYLQGSGCWSWKEDIFDPMSDELKKCSMNEPDSPPSNASGKSPILVLSQMISNFRRSRNKSCSTPNRDNRERHNSSISSRSTPTSRPDREETFVKKIFTSDNEQMSSESNKCDNLNTSVKSTVEQGTNTEPRSEDTVKETETQLKNQKQENKLLQDTLKDLFEQSKLLKAENEKLLEQNKVLNDENKKLKSDLADENAKVLIYEEDNVKLKRRNEVVLKEKSELVDELMKIRGSTDSMELKIEQSAENVESKLTNEIKELKTVLSKELVDIKNQISKSMAITKAKDHCESNHAPKKSLSGNPTGSSDRGASSKQSLSDNHVGNKGNPIPVISSVSKNKQKTVFVAGDSMTRILSTARMSDSNLNVKVQSHSGGRVRDIENTLIKKAETEPDYMKHLDAIILHVGTNNINGAKCSEHIVDEFKDTVNTIRSFNPKATIIVSSIIPRNNDRHTNEKIYQTNSAIQSMCAAQGLDFLNNDSHFLRHGEPVHDLYRDHIHLNARGGKILGTNITRLLKSILGISESDTSSTTDSSNFHMGRFQGRGGNYQSNRQMYVMPVPPYWMDGQSPWPYPAAWY